MVLGIQDITLQGIWDTIHFTSGIWDTVSIHFTSKDSIFCLLSGILDL